MLVGISVSLAGELPYFGELLDKCSVIQNKTLQITYSLITCVTRILVHQQSSIRPCRVNYNTKRLEPSIARNKTHFSSSAGCFWQFNVLGLCLTAAINRVILVSLQLSQSITLSLGSGRAGTGSWQIQRAVPVQPCSLSLVVMQEGECVEW